jgi:putative spermidine/putrescine transport system permease protein
MMSSSPWTRRLLAAIGVFGLVFLTVPIVIVVPMSFSSAKALTFPPPGFSLRWYETLFGNPQWIGAMTTSAILAVISSILSLLLGGLAAYGLRRGNFKAHDTVESNFMAPLIIPAIISAIALYLGLAKIGLLGSFFGLVMAHTVLNVPLVMMVLGVAIRSFDLRIEQVAWSLGASWSYTVRKVVLPNLAPSVFAAWIFAFIGSFDEVIVTSFVAGKYDTVPKKMFNELILEVNPTITAVATLLIGLTVIALAAVAVILHRAGRLKPTIV